MNCMRVYALSSFDFFFHCCSLLLLRFCRVFFIYFYRSLLLLIFLRHLLFSMVEQSFSFSIPLPSVPGYFLAVHSSTSSWLGFGAVTHFFWCSTPAAALHSREIFFPPALTKNGKKCNTLFSLGKRENDVTYNGSLYMSVRLRYYFVFLVCRADRSSNRFKQENEIHLFRVRFMALVYRFFFRLGC